MGGQIPTLASIQARAALDAEFRARLIGDPRAVLAELGVELPPGMRVTVQEAADARELLVTLPPAFTPAGTDDDLLSEDALSEATGGLTPFAFIPAGFAVMYGVVRTIGSDLEERKRAGSAGKP
jgi:hypothetical protein